MKFSGDEFDEEEMLDWLTDPNVMAVSDQIEQVNRKMFEKLKSRNDQLAVFFCKLLHFETTFWRENSNVCKLNFSRRKGLQAVPNGFARTRKY